MSLLLFFVVVAAVVVEAAVVVSAVGVVAVDFAPLGLSKWFSCLWHLEL